MLSTQGLRLATEFFVVLSVIARPLTVVAIYRQWIASHGKAVLTSFRLLARLHLSVQAPYASRRKPLKLVLLFLKCYCGLRRLWFAMTVGGGFAMTIFYFSSFRLQFLLLHLI